MKLLAFLSVSVLSTAVLSAACDTAQGPSKEVIALANTAEKLGSAVEATSNALHSFSKRQGVSGAFNIQLKANHLSNAIADTQSVALKVPYYSASDVAHMKPILQAINEKTVSLISTMVAKRGDLKSVGVGSIAAGNLADLEQRTYGLVGVLYATVPCEWVNLIIDGFGPVFAKFALAAKAYGNAMTNAPSAPHTCPPPCEL